MSKESSMIYVFDGDRLINVGCSQLSTDKPPLTKLEKEIFRIFKENVELKDQIEGLKTILQDQASMILKFDNYCRTHDIDMDEEILKGRE